MKIAFDVDDTLIIPAMIAGTKTDVPNYENIAIYRWFQAQGYDMIIWSGGGESYARMWGDKLGLEPFITREKKDWFDDILIAFDDCDVNLADVNVKVKRLNNSISRTEWNKHK